MFLLSVLVAMADMLLFCHMFSLHHTPLVLRQCTLVLTDSLNVDGVIFLYSSQCNVCIYLIHNIKLN